MMKIDLKMLSNLVSNQLKNIFCVDANVEEYQKRTIERLGNCFKNCGNKYFHSDGDWVFSPYHSVQYSIYLYYLAHTIYQIKGENDLSAQLYYLNKVMNSVDWYYEISLPDIFCAEHPIGSVMGRAEYSNRFFFYQGCTVGGNKGKYPSMGENVVMYANSTIIGESKIGSNVILATGTIVKDEIIPDNCIVFGQSPHITIKENSEQKMLELTQRFWR